MSDQIKATDIFDPDLFTKAIADADKFRAIIPQIIEGFKSMLEIQQKAVSGINFKDYASIEKLNKTQKEFIVLKTKIAQLKKAEITLDQKQYADGEKRAKQMDREIAEVKKSTSAYQKLSNAYKEAAAKAKDLSAEFGVNSKEAKIANENALNLRNRLVEIDTATGQAQRNVGNYTGEIGRLGKAFRGLGGLGNIAASLFGVDTGGVQQVIGGITEAGRALKDYTHVAELNGEAHKASKAAKEGEIIATEELTVAEEEEAAATALSTGGITLLIAGIVTAVAAFGAWLFVSKETKDAEDALTKSMNSQTAAIEADIEATKRINASRKERHALLMELAESEGKTDEEIKDKKKENLKREQKENLDLIRKNDELIHALIKQSVYGVTQEDRETAQKKLKTAQDESDDLLDEKNSFRIRFEILENDFNKSQLEKQKKALEKSKQQNEKYINETKGQWEKYYKDIEKIEKDSDDEIKKESFKYQKEALKQDEIWRQAQEISDNVNGDEEAKRNKKALDEIQKRKERLIDEANTIISTTEQSLERRDELTKAHLDNDISMRERNIQQQQQLAIAGRANTLAFEEAALAKDRLLQEQEKQKEIKRQKALAFLRLFAHAAESENPAQAIATALAGVAIASAISGSYKDGVEGLEGPGTETSDSILARLSKNESVITAAATRDNAGLPTAMNEGRVGEYFEKIYLPKYLSHGTGGFAENVGNSYLVKEVMSLKEEMRSVRKAIEDKPVMQNELTNVGDVINRKIRKGFIIERTVKQQQSPLNYI